MDSSTRDSYRRSSSHHRRKSGNTVQCVSERYNVYVILERRGARATDLPPAPGAANLQKLCVDVSDFGPTRT